jgi:hypothetical protein
VKQIIHSILLCLWQASATAQHIQHDLPATIDPAGYYMFYLHGGVVTVKGDNAINDPVPQFGPYQYSRILDTLHAHGFYVVSERRLPGVDDSVYARKIAQQVDTLLKANVSVSNIILVGASAGSNIVLLVSDRLKIPEMKYVIMGGCSPDIYKYYLKLKIEGRFLSIIESSDSHGTCAKIFENRKQVKDFHEIKLETGLDHGFIYKPYAAWLDPIVQWFQIFAPGYKARKPTLIDGH